MEKNLKFKIISEGLKCGISPTCRKYNISRTIYYRWLKKYKTEGLDGLNTIKKHFVPVNKTSADTENALFNLIKTYPHYGPRALTYLFEESGYTLSESAIYNIMKRNHLTRKADRLKFAKKQPLSTTPLPALASLHSGECWFFWITDYGYYEKIGNLYAYTLYDIKSKIACTRLYNEVSFEYFEDLLAAVAMPVGKTLHLSIQYLCFLEDDKLIKMGRRTFMAKLNHLIANHSFDFKVHIINTEDHPLQPIYTFKKAYTEGCLSYLMPFIREGVTFSRLKIIFQEYLRGYNIKDKTSYDGELYSPIEYHLKLTQTKLILPIWAYMDRNY